MYVDVKKLVTSPSGKEYYVDIYIEMGFIFHSYIFTFYTKTPRNRSKLSHRINWLYKEFIEFRYIHRQKVLIENYPHDLISATKKVIGEYEAELINRKKEDMEYKKAVENWNNWSG